MNLYTWHPPEFTGKGCSVMKLGKLVHWKLTQALKNTTQLVFLLGTAYV